MGNQLQSQLVKHAVSASDKLLDGIPRMLLLRMISSNIILESWIEVDSEKIDLLGRLGKAEIESYVFKGIGLNTFPVIDSHDSDLKAFCQNMKNQLNAVDCAMFIDSKVMSTWDMIDARHRGPG